MPAATHGAELSELDSLAVRRRVKVCGMTSEEADGISEYGAQFG